MHPEYVQDRDDGSQAVGAPRQRWTRPREPVHRTRWGHHLCKRVRSHTSTPFQVFQVFQVFHVLQRVGS